MVGMEKYSLYRFALGTLAALILISIPALFRINPSLLSDSLTWPTSFAYDYDRPGETTGGTAETGTDTYRNGSYWQDGAWHCPGGGGATATSCGTGGGGSAFAARWNVLPTPTPAGRGTIRAFALATSNRNAVTSCAKLAALKACLDGSETAEPSACAGFPEKQYLGGARFFIEGIGRETQSDADGVTYTAPSNAHYTMIAFHPSGEYSADLFCYKNASDAEYTGGNTIFLKTDEVMTLLVGFSPTSPWLQVSGGGDTYGGDIQSLMPLLTAPELHFDDSRAPQAPGVFTARSADLWDFSDPAAVGYGNISETNWNTNDERGKQNWYRTFLPRLNQASQHTYPPDGTPHGQKPPMIEGKKSAVYVVPGDLVIDRAWSIGAGEKLLFNVEGDLFVDAPVNLSGDGFVAFVVRGDISIGSSVGTTWDSQAPVAEGVYIAGGTIRTGRSLIPGKERFVGKGTFVADKILAQRNLGAHNASVSADLFLYNPAFLITMPDVLKDVRLQWQEVVP